MDANTLKELGRFCNSHKGCVDCGLRDHKGNCTESLFEDYNKVSSVVEKWSAEHPVKTRATDFFEKFPNAPRYGNRPFGCARNCGYTGKCGFIKSNSKACSSCWDTPMEETK